MSEQDKARLAKAARLFHKGMRPKATVVHHRDPGRPTWRYTVQVGSVSEYLEMPPTYITGAEDWSDKVHALIEAACERVILRYRRRPYHMACQRSRRLRTVPGLAK